MKCYFVMNTSIKRQGWIKSFATHILTTRHSICCGGNGFFGQDCRIANMHTKIAQIKMRETEKHMCSSQHGNRSNYEQESRTKAHRGVTKALPCLVRWFICRGPLFFRLRFCILIFFYCNFMKIKCFVPRRRRRRLWDRCRNAFYTLERTEHRRHSICDCDFRYPMQCRLLRK